MADLKTTAKTTQDMAPAAKRKITLGDWLPGAIFIIILGIGLFAWYSQQSHAKSAKLAAESGNTAVGLPADYPSDVVPLMEGLKVNESNKDEAKSKEGDPMDRWTIKASTAQDPKAVFEYYNKLLLDKGLQQTMYISIPTGYGVDFADADQVINFVIEKDASKQETTNVEIQFHRMKKT